MKLLADDGAAGNSFGNSVAISADTIVVGAWGHDGNGLKSSGSAHVFVRNGNSWMQQAKLLPSDAAARDNFGLSVAIADDTIAVGAY